MLLFSIPQVSALQADVKSLKTNITETMKNEQKALAECRTLQEALNNKKSLESTLRKKDNDIKRLETEVQVCSCLNLSADILFSRARLQKVLFIALWTTRG